MSVRRDPEIAGVILAGGQSTRLGRDKARIMLGGVDLLARTAHLMAEVLDDIWVAGRDPAPHGLDLPYLLDQTPGLGPIGGIVTALKTLNRPCLVISCDLPLLGLDTLDALLEARDPCSGALITTYLQVETGYIEALVSIYEPTALPVLERALNLGRHKLSAVLDSGMRTHIPYSRDEALPFFNINYPADLAMLRKLVPEQPRDRTSP